MAKWKKKSLKKLSVRKRRRLIGAKYFGEKHLSSREKTTLDRAVDRFIRESSCRHKQPLGSPCESFDEASGGKCKRDGNICDLLTEKGKRYMREYEDF